MKSLLAHFIWILAAMFSCQAAAQDLPAPPILGRVEGAVVEPCTGANLSIHRFLSELDGRYCAVLIADHLTLSKLRKVLDETGWKFHGANGNYGEQVFFKRKCEYFVMAPDYRADVVQSSDRLSFNVTQFDEDEEHCSTENGASNE